MPTAQRNLTDPSDSNTFTFRDDWALSVAYSANDVVPHSDGTTYVCISAHTSASDNEPGVGLNWATYWKIWARSIVPGATIESPALLGFSEKAKDFALDVASNVYTADLGYSYHYWLAQSGDLTIKLPTPTNTGEAKTLVFELTQDTVGGHGIEVRDGNNQPVPRFIEGDTPSVRGEVTNTLVAQWSPARQSWAYRFTGDVDWRAVVTHFEDFGAMTLAAAPTGWTEEWDGLNSDWTVESDATAGGQSVQHVATASTLRALTWDAVEQVRNAEIFSMVRSSSTGTTTSEDKLQNRLLLQVSGAAGSESAYYAQIETDGNVALGQYSGGAETTFAKGAFAWSANDRIAMRLRSEYSEKDGTLTVRCKAWIPATPSDPVADEPASWTLSYVDDVPLAAGKAGIGAWGHGGTRIFERVGTAVFGGTAPVN